MRIGIVGPCAAGKSTLAGRLLALGYDAHDCAQEHSQVQSMWRRITNPDFLVYLDANLATIRQRLDVDWDEAYVDELNRRLTDARAHADFYLPTDQLTIDQVVTRVVEILPSA